MKRFIAYILVSAMISAAGPTLARTELYEWTELAEKAPMAAFTMEKGSKRTLADFKGQLVLVNLWATWCTPCLKELPSLAALEEKYAAQGLVVIPLSIDDMPFDQLRAFMDKNTIELPHLAQDTSGELRKVLVGRGLPVSYIVSREGDMLYKYEGATDWMAGDQPKKIEELLKLKSR